MPQEFQVLKCISCSAFQVQLSKKSGKWSCVKCGTKQTLMKVYAVSNNAKDCRAVCVSLSTAQGEAQEQQADSLFLRANDDDYGAAAGHAGSAAAAAGFAARGTRPPLFRCQHVPRLQSTGASTLRRTSRRVCPMRHVRVARLSQRWLEAEVAVGGRGQGARPRPRRRARASRRPSRGGRITRESTAAAGGRRMRLAQRRRLGRSGRQWARGRARPHDRCSHSKARSGHSSSSKWWARGEGWCMGRAVHEVQQQQQQQQEAAGPWQQGAPEGPGVRRQQQQQQQQHTQHTQHPRPMQQQQQQQQPSQQGQHTTHRQPWQQQQQQFRDHSAQGGRQPQQWPLSARQQHQPTRPMMFPAAGQQGFGQGRQGVTVPAPTKVAGAKWGSYVDEEEPEPEASGDGMYWHIARCVGGRDAGQQQGLMLR